ncbi:MAG: NAD(P)-binding domain-containing protein, partial [Cryobacterium sp.]
MNSRRGASYCRFDPAHPPNEGMHIMTTISIIGAGNMATAIGARAAAHGHSVEIMSRDSGKARAAADQ